jgi:hypothetical protein
MEKIVVGSFLCGRPSSAPTPAHFRVQAGLPARYHTAVDDRRGPSVSSLFPQISPPLLARVATPAKLPTMGQPPITTPRHKDGRVFTCHLESSRRPRCTVASHHRRPHASALVGDAPVRFRSRSLSDKALEQATMLAKLSLPNACRGGHRLALPVRARSRVDRVRWHSPLCHMACLSSDAPSTSPPPAAKGQCHARVAFM